jgi:hypothetical protein
MDEQRRGGIDAYGDMDMDGYQWGEINKGKGKMRIQKIRKREMAPKHTKRAFNLPSKE